MGTARLIPSMTHILEAKVRGKSHSIDEPKIALVTIGRISADWHRAVLMLDDSDRGVVYPVGRREEDLSIVP